MTGFGVLTGHRIHASELTFLLEGRGYDVLCDLRLLLVIKFSPLVDLTLDLGDDGVESCCF